MLDEDWKAEYAAMDPAERDADFLSMCGQGMHALEGIVFLLGVGANPNAKSRNGQTPLAAAAATHGSEKLVALLLAKGANVNVSDQFGDTPLRWAAYLGSAANCAAMLAKGAEVNHANDDGETPLLSAVHGLKYNPKCRDAVAVLLAAGADPNITATGGARRGSTALTLAKELGDGPLVHLLETAAEKRSAPPMVPTQVVRQAPSALVHLLAPNGDCICGEPGDVWAWELEDGTCPECLEVARRTGA